MWAETNLSSTTTAEVLSASARPRPTLSPDLTAFRLTRLTGSDGSIDEVFAIR
jgi:hypothetical protein